MASGPEPTTCASAFYILAFSERRLLTPANINQQWHLVFRGTMSQFLVTDRSEANVKKGPTQCNVFVEV